MVLEEEIRRLSEEKKVKKQLDTLMKSRLGWKFKKGGFWGANSLTKTVNKTKLELFIWGTLVGLTSYDLRVNDKSIAQEDSLPDREIVKKVNSLLRSQSKIVRLAKLQKVL